MTFLLLYLCIVASAVLFTEACRCPVRHPQTYVCLSDYVIKARIIREKTTTSNRKYRVKVLANYKGRNAKPYVNSRVWIYSALHSSTCGARFDKGSTYIITGSIGQDRKLRTSTCHWNVKVSDLTSFQKKALERGIYYKNCKCEICTQNMCESGKGCIVPYNKFSCYYESAACKRSSGTCKWTKDSC